MKDTLKLLQIEKASDRGRVKEETFIIAERPVTLFLNDREIVTLLATPENLKELPVGFYLPAAGFPQKIGRASCRERV